MQNSSEKQAFYTETIDGYVGKVFTRDAAIERLERVGFNRPSAIDLLDEVDGNCLTPSDDLPVVKGFDATRVDWRWQRNDGELILVTESGGSKVVLEGHIQTRDTVTGILRPIVESDGVAMLIAKAPGLRRAVAGQRTQIETMSAIAKTRERQFKETRDELAGLKMTMSAIEVDDRVPALITALLKHAVIGRYQSGNADGSPKQTGLRCLECGAQSNEPDVVTHEPHCIIARLLNA